MAKKHPAEIELARLRALLQPPLMHFPAVDTKKLLAESTEKSKMGNPIARAWFIVSDHGPGAVALCEFNPQRIVTTGQKLKDAGPAYADEITATIALRNKLAAKFADTLAALDDKINNSFGLGAALGISKVEGLTLDAPTAQMIAEQGPISTQEPTVESASMVVRVEKPTVTTKIAKRTPKQAREAAEKKPRGTTAEYAAAAKKDKFVARGVKAPSKDAVKAKADKIEKLADKKKGKK